jgi:maleate isomerase
MKPRRIGLISPTVLEVITDDFVRLAPDNVKLCGITCNMKGWSHDNYARALGMVDDAARYLSERQVEFIIHVGSPLVVAQGAGFDLKLIDRIRQAAGCEATTTIRAAIDAFARLGVSRPALVTPFPQDLNKQLTDFLAANSIHAANLVTVPAAFAMLQDVPRAALVEAAHAAVKEAPGADCIYIPSGQLPATAVVQQLEAEIGMPVIAQGDSDFCAAFAYLGVKPKHCVGRLTASL